MFTLKAKCLITNMFQLKKNVAAANSTHELQRGRGKPF